MSKFIISTSAPIVESASDPAASDSGYRLGTIWVNTTSKTSYICVDNTSGAAEWSSGGGGSTPVVSTPNNVSPANTDTDVAFSSLQLTGGAFGSLYGIAHAKREFEIYSDSGLVTLVYDGETTTGDLTKHTVTDTLGTLTQYWWRCRDTDASANVSSWSTATSFTTTDTTVATPTITLPVTGSLQRDDAISCTSSVFSTSHGTETHVSSSWKVTSDGAGSLVIDSVTESVTDLESWTADLSTSSAADTVYFWVKHHGSISDSSWSPSVSCTLTTAVATPSVTSPADATSVTVDSTIEFVSTAFSSVVASDTHVSTSWQLTLATDTGFASPILNVVEDTVNKTSYSYDSTGDLTDGVSYIARVRHHGSVDAGAWSSANTYTAAAASTGWLKYESGTAFTWYQDYAKLAIDSSGNSYTVYYQNSQTTGSDDMSLVKIGVDGTYQWAKRWGGTGGDYLYGVACDSSDNVVVCGYTTSIGAGGADAFVGKLNSSGTKVWFKYFGGTGHDFLYGVACDSSDNVVVCGYTASMGAGSYDAFIGKLNSSGTKVWFKYFGGTGYDFLYGVACDSSDNVVVCGNTTSIGAGSYDAFIGKLNSSGTKVWFKYFGGTNYDYLYGVACDASGNVYTAGKYNEGTYTKPLIGRCSTDGFSSADPFINDWAVTVNDESTWTVNDASWAVNDASWTVNDWAVTPVDMTDVAFTSLLS